jgi:hypothetical protein
MPFSLRLLVVLFFEIVLGYMFWAAGGFWFLALGIVGTNALLFVGAWHFFMTAMENGAELKKSKAEAERLAAELEEATAANKALEEAQISGLYPVPFIAELNAEHLQPMDVVAAYSRLPAEMRLAGINFIDTMLPVWQQRRYSLQQFPTYMLRNHRNGEWMQLVKSATSSGLNQDQRNIAWTLLADSPMKDWAAKVDHAIRLNHDDGVLKLMGLWAHAEDENLKTMCAEALKYKSYAFSYQPKAANELLTAYAAGDWESILRMATNPQLNDYVINLAKLIINRSGMLQVAVEALQTWETNDFTNMVNCVLGASDPAPLNAALSIILNWGGDEVEKTFSPSHVIHFIESAYLSMKLAQSYNDKRRKAFWQSVITQRALLKQSA